MSSRALTQAEEGAVRRSSSIDDLDSLLESLHSQILPGTVILFEIPSSSKIKLSKQIILGRYRTLFFGQTFEKSEFDSLVKDLILIVREKMLGERAIKNLASSIQVCLFIRLINQEQKIMKELNHKLSFLFQALYDTLCPRYPDSR